MWQAAAALVAGGKAAIVPIVWAHALARHGVPSDWAYWPPPVREYLVRRDGLVVLQLDGWRESEGVQAEITLASALGKRVDNFESAEASR